MPPERLPWDRKDLRKYDRSTPRWRESSSSHYGSSRDFCRWGGSNDFRRPPGHGKQGWHLFADKSGHGYAPPFRSGDRILEDKNFRSSISRGDSKYGRNSRDNRGSFSQREWKAHSWDITNGSQNTSGRLLDASNNQQSVDDMLTYRTSHTQPEFSSTWDQLHSKDQHDNNKLAGLNGLETGQRGDRETSLDWKLLKWTRSGSLSSRGSGFSNSSSSRSLRGADSGEEKAEFQMKNASLVQSPSGEAATCVTSAPSDEMNARKKPRLKWGEGLAKYEKKKVEGPEVNVNKDGSVYSSNNVDTSHSQSSNLVDKSPRLMGLSECASPATPSSVACCSPGLEEKTFSKALSVDIDVTNLCRLPNIVSPSHIEGFSFNLEVLDGTLLTNLESSLNELFQYDDSSSVDSSFMRSTLMNKLLILKDNISKTLEVTESEIDSLENELKSLKYESGGRCAGPAVSSSFPVQDDAKLCGEQASASDNIPRPFPLQVLSCGAVSIEKVPDCNSVLEEVHCGTKDDVDSPGSATSKFVEPITMPKAVSLCDPVKPDQCSGDVNGVHSPTMVSKSFAHCTDVEDFGVYALRNVDMLSESKEVAYCCSDMSCTEDNLCDLILAANKESASRASEVFSNLLPREHCKIDLSEVANVSLWKNDALVREKFALRKRFLKFTERVVTLKFKAFQRLWKEDMRSLSMRKYHAKSHKKCESSLRTTQCLFQKNRSSIRSRFYSPVGNLSLVPITEMLNFTSKLLSDSQVKCYRDDLKMPALILDKKERMASQFISSNGLVEDPWAVEKERAMINPWTAQEKEIFIDKLATFGKDFHKIASFLDHKTTADCVEFYYKNHKSDCFEKTKKSKQAKTSTNYLVASGKNWGREMNAASLDVLGAASFMAAEADNAVGNQQICAGRVYLTGGCSDSKISNGEDVRLDRSTDFDMLKNERETAAAADVLAGICGSMSSEAMSSCITTSIDPGEGCQEWKSPKVKSLKKQHSPSDVTQSGDEETCSDESCGEMDPSDWTDEEKSIFVRAVSSYGKDFAMISRCVRTRSRDQCKVFFSKARKCLGLDLIPVGHENSDDPVGGGSDTEDGRALQTCLIVCTDKLGSNTEEELPKHEESDTVDPGTLPTDLNNSKDCHVAGPPDQDVSKVEFVSNSCLTEDKLNLPLDNQLEFVQAQETSNESVNSEAKREEPIEDGNPAVQVIFVGEAVDHRSSNPTEVKVEVAANRNGDHLEGKELLLTDYGLDWQIQDSDGSGSMPHLLKDSHSNSSIGVENIHHVSVEQSPVMSLLQENRRAISDSVLQASASIPCEKMLKQEVLSSQLDNQDNRDNLGQIFVYGGDHFQHLPAESLINGSESSRILGGHPRKIPIKREMNGDIPSRVVSDLSVSPRCAANRFASQDCYLQKCNRSQAQLSVPELPLLPQHAEQGTDNSRSSSDVEKPCRNGDVKLFGKILSNPSSLQKPNSDAHENVERGGAHCGKPGSKSSNLKFTGHQTSDGNSSVVKFDRNNYLGLENVPMKSYGFWDGSKIQTGFSSIPEYFMAKYPAAFGNYHLSSSKIEQHALQAAAKCSEHNLSSVSVLPVGEISGGNGVVDYQMYRSHEGVKVQPFSVDLKQQRQDIFCEMQRNGFEAIPSLQQQGRGMVGMNGVGRPGIIIGGGVSDPVAALKMHYSKTEQYGGQNGTIIREEETWRSRGDVGR